MSAHILFVEETGSTNNLLHDMARQRELPEGFLVHTDYQSAGKGQAGNTWESERGQNLLFSLLLYPENIKINRQFILSQLTCLAIKRVLERYTDGICIKWPNDLYCYEQKIGGILIENSLVRDKIAKSIIGVGLNINQQVFTSDAPNPVSLRQIVGQAFDRMSILLAIHNELMVLYRSLDAEYIQTDYHRLLYRREGFHRYKETATNTIFSAKIDSVSPDGQLMLITSDGASRGYYFKEVEFIR